MSLIIYVSIGYVVAAIDIILGGSRDIKEMLLQAVCITILLWPIVPLFWLHDYINIEE